MTSAILFCSLYEGHHVVKELILMVGKSPTLQDQDKQGVDSPALRPVVHTASNHTTKRSLCPLPHLDCIALGELSQRKAWEPGEDRKGHSGLGHLFSMKYPHCLDCSLPPSCQRTSFKGLLRLPGQPPSVVLNWLSAPAAEAHPAGPGHQCWHGMLGHRAL